MTNTVEARWLADMRVCADSGSRAGREVRYGQNRVVNARVIVKDFDDRLREIERLREENARLREINAKLLASL